MSIYTNLLLHIVRFAHELSSEIIHIWDYKCDLSVKETYESYNSKFRYLKGLTPR